MENKTVTLSRHLALVSLVLRQPGISVDDLAELLSLTSEQVRDEVLLLDEVGVGDLLPGEALFFDLEQLENEGRVSLTYEVHMAEPPLLTKTEIAYLTVGLARLGGSLVPPDPKEVQLAMSTIVSLAQDETVPFGPNDFDALLNVADPEIETSIYATVQDALEMGVLLELTYLSAAGKTSNRVVEPISLLQGAEGWLLNAWCTSAAGLRTFRLDRIVRATLGQRVSKRPAVPVKRTRGKRCSVTLSEDAGWAIGELPIVRRVEGDGDFTVTFEVLDEDWMVTRLIMLAPYVMKVEPAKYLEAARSRAESARSLWSEASGN